jgi:hypothetical protein
MSMNNSGKVGFAMVQVVRQGFIIVSPLAPLLVAIFESVGTIQ